MPPPRLARCSVTFLVVTSLMFPPPRAWCSRIASGAELHPFAPGAHAAGAGAQAVPQRTRTQQHLHRRCRAFHPPPHTHTHTNRTYVIGTHARCSCKICSMLCWSYRAFVVLSGADDCGVPANQQGTDGERRAGKVRLGGGE
jgi:hypothetical protein